MKSDNTENWERTQSTATHILPGERTVAHPLSEQCGPPSKGEDAPAYDTAVLLSSAHSLEWLRYQTHDTECAHSAVL